MRPIRYFNSGKAIYLYCRCASTVTKVRKTVPVYGSRGIKAVMMKRRGNKGQAQQSEHGSESLYPQQHA